MPGPSLKRLQIDKANTTMVVVMAVAVFVTIFSLLSAKTLLSELFYQDRVINAKSKALIQLKADVNAEQQLVASYEKFVGTPKNLIGGNSTGNSANDGDNAKIILDALPSQYDFPALTTSVQNLLTGQGLKVDSISGTDQQASLSGGSTSSSTPAVTTTTAKSSPPIGGTVAMPFQFSVDGPYAKIQSLVNAFESSIRPFQFQTVQLSGGQSDLTLTVTAQTFYQPQKDFKITTEKIQ
jgi:hypothetical protein